MKRIHVLSVLNTLYFGGGENRVLALARAIDRDRFQHTVLTFKRADIQRERELGSLRPYFEASGIEVVDLGESPPEYAGAHGTIGKVASSLPRLARTLQKLTAFIRTHRVDIVDAHIGTGKQIGTAAAVLTRRPAVVTTYGLERFDPWWLYRASETAVLNAASALVTDSHEVASMLRNSLFFPKRIEVIPNGIPAAKSTIPNDEMRRQFGLPLDPHVRIVGQVSSFTPRKGHLVLLEAARRVVERYPNVHFLMCGFTRAPFDYERRVRERARELGLESYVTFAGYPGPIEDVFSVLDIQVHAATGESLPQAIIEGMSAGKPAVVTAVAGVPSIVSHEETGLVVRPGDVDALANGLLRLLDDRALAQRLGDAGYQRFLARYTDTRMARDIERLFVEIAR